MFQAIRQLQPKERKQILVNTENGVTASEKKQLEIAKNHFKEVLQRRGEDEIKDIEPTECCMIISFSFKDRSLGQLIILLCSSCSLFPLLIAHVVWVSYS